MERSLEKTRLDINMDRIDLDNEAEEIETQVAAKKKEQFDKYEGGAPGQQEDEVASPKKARAKIGSKKSTVPISKSKKRAAVEPVSGESAVDDDESEAQPEQEPSPVPLRRTTSSRRIVTKASSSTGAPAKVRQILKECMSLMEQY